MRSLALFLGSVSAALLLTANSIRAEEPGDGFLTIFDGKTLDGWHVSSQTGHGHGDFTKQFVRYRKIRVKELD